MVAASPQDDDAGVQAAVDALYAGPLDAFVGARNALAKRLREMGQRDAAVQVKALAKPSVSAWATNQLFWHERAAFEALLDAADAVRRAQACGAGPTEQAAAAKQRRACVDRLLGAAEDHLRRGGHAPALAILRRIATSLDAAAAFGRAGRDRPGRWSVDLQPPGFELLADHVHVHVHDHDHVHEHVHEHEHVHDHDHDHVHDHDHDHDHDDVGVATAEDRGAAERAQALARAKDRVEAAARDVDATTRAFEDAQLAADHAADALAAARTRVLEATRQADEAELVHRRTAKQVEARAREAADAHEKLREATHALARLTSALAIVALPLAAAVSGCAAELPLQERIASTRPLAMRIEVVDPAADPDDAVRLEALPFETIRAIPLFVDERDVLGDDAIIADIDPVWLACPMQPIEGVFSCLRRHLPLTLNAIEACPALDPTAFDPSDPVLPEIPIPCRITGGTAARPEVQVPLHANLLIGGDLEIVMIGHEPGRGDTPACAEALLTDAAETPGNCIFVVQRASVGPDARILQLAQMFGVPELEGLPIPDEIPDADRNPRITSFTVAVVVDEEVVQTVDTARGEVITAPHGATIAVVTEAPASDLQTYLVPRDNTSFEERVETYSAGWYRTWGDLLSPVSDDPLSTNELMLVRGEQDETDAPPSGRTTLYYVLRDDRQGVDWWWVHIDVGP